ncbi:sensor histidine kinase [Nocardia donostiensis]|uniref:histidine kinase n=1 Tax=Nocardia donostiensis TaxID=1538463 RepID=A0A1W0B001_9NOCA|nr:histidine kinase [Nocardia donostiensis]ONM50132.1 sensor histidine kinase [Nocardia donostiensis]OQS15794.1 sensor histidine kinase [Nocardia donostiensis]OQS23599.1 sensor histidine kinase [Nocardia donostiensis]
MRRFSLWLRDKPVITDSALAVALLVVDVLGVGDAEHKAGYLVMSVLLPLPLVLRRIYPREMAALLLVLSLTATTIGYLLADDAMHSALLGLGIMLYTLVAYVGRRDGLWYLTVLVVDTGYAIVAVTGFTGTDLAFIVLYFALCWTLAEFVGARHAYDAEVAARLAVADYDRERSAHDAVSAERTRIARELHDVVAHAVSVMIVQADGARYALHRDPDAAEQALVTIAGSGREALRELRRTVALLRTEHAPDQVPQHGTAGLAKVVQMMRDTGLAVDLELSGELDGIAPEISLGVHRIVQESLTNTLRHAGAHPKAWVRVHRRERDVEIEVTDSGGVPVHASGQRIQGSGLGLAGMRERVAVLGGAIEAGRTAEGAWRVHATIPLTPPQE